MNLKCPGCGIELYPANRINWNDVNWCYECVYERSGGAVKDQMARVLGKKEKKTLFEEEANDNE